MRLFICFCQLASGKFRRRYGIEEHDLPAIDCAEIENVATAIKNYDVPWFKRLAANAHF